MGLEQGYAEGILNSYAMDSTSQVLKALHMDTKGPKELAHHSCLAAQKLGELV